MEFVFYTNSISPHQIPLARELIKKFGESHYRYVYTSKQSKERTNLGWAEESEPWIIYAADAEGDVVKLLETADVAMCENRDTKLFAKRAKKHKITVYSSERWFKPNVGIMRLLNPHYLQMAAQFVKLISKSCNIYYFPQGIHAARDMARLCGLMHGDLRCLFCAPKLDFERKPGGKIWLKNGGDDKRYCLDKMRIWAYYVEPSKFDALPVQESSDPRTSQQTRSQRTTPTAIRVLWVGRLLNWKRVDTIVRAVGEHANLKRADNSLPKITLDIYGVGPEEKRLKKLAAKYGDCIKFYPPVPIADVRKLMREHDVYVLASNAYEGWGAVVSEALEEGTKVIGTYEAGSSVTMLPEECLFHAGDWRRLMFLLHNSFEKVTNAKGWNVIWAADALAHFVRGI